MVLGISRRTIIGAMVASFLCVMGVAAQCAEPLPTTRPNLDVMKIAHRGAAKYAPENTIPAMEKAIKIGMDYVELDLRYTKDGVPVCMHDPRVQRTTDGEGTVAEMTLAEIKKLDAGSWFKDGKKFAGTRVPTFEEALQTMQGRIKLYVDQKESPRPVTIELLEKYGFLPDNMVVVGGIAKQVEFRALYPGAPVMPPVRRVEDIERVLKEMPSPKSFNVDCSNITEQIIDEAHAAGVMVFVNTLNWGDQMVTMKKVIKMGPDAIQTDNPAWLMKTLYRMKKKKEARDK